MSKQVKEVKGVQVERVATAVNNVMPTLARALEIVKGFKRPLNGYVVVLSPLVPAFRIFDDKVIQLDKDTQEEMQTRANIKDGVLIVKSPFEKRAGSKPPAMHEAFAGERAIINKDTQINMGKVITTEELIEGVTPIMIANEISLSAKNKIKPNTAQFYRKYNLLFIRSSDLVCIMD